MQLVWTRIWSWFGGGWSGIKKKKWKKWQKRVEKLCFSISHEHAKNSHSRAKWTRKLFWLQLKGKTKNWFRMTMRKFRTIMWNALRRRNCCWYVFHFAQSCEIAYFLDFLMKKPPEDPLDDAKCPLDLDL